MLLLTVMGSVLFALEVTIEVSFVRAVVDDFKPAGPQAVNSEANDATFYLTKIHLVFVFALRA